MSSTLGVRFTHSIPWLESTVFWYTGPGQYIYSSGCLPWLSRSASVVVTAILTRTQPPPRQNIKILPVNYRISMPSRWNMKYRFLAVGNHKLVSISLNFIDEISWKIFFSTSGVFIIISYWIFSIVGN